MEKRVEKRVILILMALLVVFGLSGAVLKLGVENSNLRTQNQCLLIGGVAPPEIVRNATSEEIREILMENLVFEDKVPKMYVNGVEYVNEIYFSDSLYTITSEEEIKRFLSLDSTDRVRYGSFFDCDDYAFRLMGQMSVPGPNGEPGWSSVALGIIWTRDHAFNLVVCADEGELVLYAVEPATDRMWKVKPHSINASLVIF